MTSTGYQPESDLDSASNLLKNYRTPVLLVFLGIGLAIFGFIMALNFNMSQLEKEFDQFSDNKYNELERKLENYVTAIRVVQASFVDKKGFDEKHFNDIKTPLISDGQFSKFIWIERDGNGDYINKHRDSQNDRGEKKKLGIMEYPEIMRLVHNKTSDISLSSPFKMLTEDGDKIDIALIFSVYDKDDKYLGSVAAILDFADILLHHFDWQDKLSSVKIEISEISDNDKDLIFVNDGAEAFKARLDDNRYGASQFRNSFSYEKDLSILQKNWSFSVYPNPEYLSNALDYTPWAILIFGLILTTVISTVLFSMVNKNLKAKRMVQTIEKQKEKLAQKNKELEEFSYRTSHDLRSPLISSVGLLKYIEKQVNSDKKEAAIKSVNMAKESLNKLIDLVQDLLTLTKTEHEHEDKKTINIEEIIDDAVKKFDNMENFDRLKFTKDYKFDKRLTAKKSRLQLIVENLISNAIKYQDVEKSDSYVKISTKESNGNFIFIVEDNGLGVPENQRENLFLMFKRFHPKTSFGSGLGLYMIKKSADVLNGKILFKGDDERTIFKLKVPLS